MAEPAGILIRVHITEERLASLFRQQVAHGAGKASVGHVLSEHLDQGDLSGDILIVNHDPEAGTLFLGWILNHYDQEAAASIWRILDALADRVEPTALAEGAVTSTLPQCLESLRIQDGCLIRGSAQLVSQQELDSLSDQLWSFARKDEFPDAAQSMRRRNYQCKPFKRAWKKYLKWRDEQERPARIAAATETHPYSLMPGVLCWDGKVFERNSYTGRDTPIPGADPLTFRLEAGFFADKNHVWHIRRATNSPPSTIQTDHGIINNPEAIWEYHVVPGAVGADFTWLNSRWDTVFWTDKRRIYAHDRELGLIPLPDIDASEFRMCGQCFGTDGKAVFYRAKRLPLNVVKLQTDEFFIWDDKKVFYASDEVPLNGRTFRILGRKRVPGIIGERFRLADADKTIIFGPSNICLPDDPLF